MWKSVVFDSPKRNKIVKKLKYASCENLSSKNCTGSSTEVVFRGRYNSFVPSLNPTLHSPVPVTKENKVSFLKKLFESKTTASAINTCNLSNLNESGYSLSCPSLDKIVTDGDSPEDSPFREKSTLYIKLHKNNLESQLDKSYLSPNKACPKSICSKSTQFKVSTITKSRKSISVVNTPIKSVEEIRKKFSPSFLKKIEP